MMRTIRDPLCEIYHRTMTESADAYDEFEALALGVEPTRLVETKQETKPTEAITPLVKIFQDLNIRILGSVDEPLFCAADLAAHIGEPDYRHTIKKDEPGFTQTAKALGKNGQTREMMFLTEMGAYRFMLQSKRKEALDFQMFTYNLLKAERKRTVDALQLALKIEKTRCEQLRQAKLGLQEERQDLLAEVNSGREKIKGLTRKNAAAQRRQNAAADAKELRLCGRQVEQIKGWNC